MFCTGVQLCKPNLSSAASLVAITYPSTPIGWERRIPYRLAVAVAGMSDDLLTAAINLLEARANQMLTETEWEALAQAVKEATGQQVEWRTYDELNTE